MNPSMYIFCTTEPLPKSFAQFLRAALYHAVTGCDTTAMLHSSVTSTFSLKGAVCRKQNYAIFYLVQVVLGTYLFLVRKSHSLPLRHRPRNAEMETVCTLVILLTGLQSNDKKQSYSYWTPPISPTSEGLRTLETTPNIGELLTERATESTGPYSTVIIPPLFKTITVTPSPGPYSTVIIPPLFKTVTITVDQSDSSDTPLLSQQTSATSTSSYSATFSDSLSFPINEPEIKSLNMGAIIGGVLGGLTIVGTIFIAMYWIRRRHPDGNKSEKSAGANDESLGTTSEDVEETPYELPGTQTAPELDDTAVLPNRLPTS